MKRKLMFVFMVLWAICVVFAGCNDKEQTPLNTLMQEGVQIDGGNFPYNSALVVKKVDVTGDEGTTVVSAISEQNYDKDGKVFIYDISVVADGATVQPSENIKVTMPAPDADITNYVVFHVKGDNAVEALTATLADGKLSFATSSLSYFVVAESAKEVAPKYTFKATVENGGGKIEFGGMAQANGYAAQMKEGATVKLKAVADELYTFVGWYAQEDSPTLISSDAEHTFTMGKTDLSVFARFEETYTEAQNYADFINSLNYSLNFDGANGYTCKYGDEYSYSSGDKKIYQGTETMLGDKFASVYREISTPYNETDFEEISALKTVTVNGKERKKWVSFVTNSDGSKQNEGRLKSALFDLELVAWYMPTRWFDYLCMDVSGDTFEEYAAAFIQAYNEDNAEYNNQTSDVTLKRNADGTLTFGFVASGAYKVPWIQETGYQQTVFYCKYEIILDGSRITKLTSYNVYDYVYEDEAQNNQEILIENYEYGYSFDSDLYESVPTETDTTVDEVTSSTISVYINGYKYRYSMSDIALDSTVTLDDVLNHLSDGGEGLSKPLFNTRHVDKSLFKVYTDKEMTQEFTTLTLTDERYTLYVKMTPPSDKAIVMCLREYGEVRSIDLCYLMDLNTNYNPANLGSTYPVIEIDGTAISNNEYYQITCSESRIYFIVSKVR